MQQRQELLVKIANYISSHKARGVLKVAIDGVDGSGKTMFADELTAVLRDAGVSVIRASVDSFHNPKAIRYARGRSSPEGFFLDSYNYDHLQQLLLRPLTTGGTGHYKTGAFDHRIDAVIDEPEREAKEGEVLIFDGIFLHRDEIKFYWDLSIFLAVDFNVSIPRCAQRGDGSPDPNAEQNRRYIDGQKLYLSRCRPMESATLVIDNNDLAKPKILKGQDLISKHGNQQKRNIAFFDFDGTITVKDTFTPFIHYSVSPIRMALGKLVLAPIIAAYTLHLIHASFIRSCICRIAYLGRREKEIYKLGAAYAKDHLSKMIRPNALKRIAWHKSRGDVVVIVSASLHFYLRDWCRLQGVELLCTEVTGLGGILTGGFSPSDCTGKQKSRRVREKYDLNSYSTIYAYGDTQDDVPLLNLAHKKYFRWSETSDINAVITAIQSARRDPDSPQRLKEIEVEDRALVRLIDEQYAMDQASGDGVFANILVKASGIHGNGVFAKRDILPGETIIPWTICNDVLTTDQVAILPEGERKYLSKIDGRFILFKPPARFVNHSCNPNAYASNEEGIARRLIKAGEEITVEYASEDIPNLNFQCRCGSLNCRGVISNPTSTPDLWQPHLAGELLHLRPLKAEDYEELFAAGSDPAIWQQHPERDRYKREKFVRYFQSGIDSLGAFAILDRKAGVIIGSSRFTGYDPKRSVVEIGYTFLTRAYWGQGYNRELKTLMLNYAFQYVDKVHFYIGQKNLRSRRAVEKLGAVLHRIESRKPLQGESYTSVVYEILKQAWQAHPHQNVASDVFIQPEIATERLVLEPIVETHAEEMWALFSDPDLHKFVPYEPLTMKEQRKRCAAWAMRRSPDEREIWLNWAARDKQTHQVMAHFQVGIKEDQVATVAYLVARAFQRQGFAYEGLKTVFEYLREEAHVREVKVWSDTRNAASHGLARKLGMIQVDTIKDADYFKGASSDEFVFSKRLHEPPERISIRPLKSSDIEKIVRYFYDSPRADLDRMGVDVERLPPRKEMMNSLLDVASIPAGQASSCYMIWEIGGVSVGFSSLKDIIPGEHGGMHLHMWDVGSRGRGFGAELFCRSALEFYRLYKLPTIFCEPSSKNPMPNGMLRKLGFPLIRTYRGRSSALSAETELNRYEVTRSVAERFLKENGRAARFEAAATSESGMSL